MVINTSNVKKALFHYGLPLSDTRRVKFELIIKKITNRSYSYSNINDK